MPKNPRVPVDVVAKTDKFNASVKGATKAAGAAFAAMGAASAAAMVGIVKATVDLSAKLNQLAKDAKRVGVGVEEFQKLDGAIGLLTDGTVKVTDALQEYQKRTGEAAPDLAALADRFAGLNTAAERTALGMELFGSRAGKQLAGALSEGGDAVQAAIDQIEGAGLVSAEAAAQSEVLQDAIAEAKQQFSKLYADALVPLIPALTDTARLISDLMAAARESGLSEFTEDLGDVASGAILAARALFGLDAAQRQQQASTEAGQAAIIKQSERIEEIRGQIEAWASVSETSRNPIALAAQAGELATLNDQLDRQVEVLRRLRGELSKDAGLLPTTAGGGGGRPTGGSPAPTVEVPAPGPTPEALDEAISAEDAYFNRRALEMEEYAAAAAVLEEEIAASHKGAEESIRTETWETQKQRAAALSQGLNAATQVFTLIGNLHQTLTDGQISNLEEGSDAHEAALTKQWEGQTAIAITTAALNVGLAISNAFANAPNPIVGGIMAAISGTVATVNLGVVIAKAAQGPPTFHMGGDVRGVGPGPLPDEVNATLLAGERVQSRAEVRNGGAPTRVTTVFQVGPRTVDAMVQEATRTGAGATYDALRANRPRRIGRARIN